jgi:hypothetical protein
LASSSSVFEAMLTNGMKETFEDEIQLSQTNHSAFLSLLTFIYTSNVKITSLCEAESLLELADRFAILPVREECLRYFRLELNLENIDNVWGIWAIAGKLFISLLFFFILLFISNIYLLYNIKRNILVIKHQQLVVISLHFVLIHC